ncbi:hypothetical protein ABIA96_006523 [Bradyrhizobium sp. LB11.1]
MAQGLVFGGLVEKGAIQAALEDGADRGDGSRLHKNAARAGRVDALAAVALTSDRMPGQMRKPCSGSGRAAMLDWKKAAVDGPIGSPAAITLAGVHCPQRRWALGMWSVTVVCGPAGLARARCWRSAAVVEDLDHPVVDGRIYELTDEPIRRGIPVSVDLDMIVGADPASIPAREIYSIYSLGEECQCAARQGAYRYSRLGAEEYPGSPIRRGPI